jgi:hypothetical protein
MKGSGRPTYFGEHDLELFVVLREHVRPRRDRVIGERRAPVFPVVVRDRFPRQRGRERHREPVEDLRVRLREHDVEHEVVAAVHAGELPDALVLDVHGQRGERRIRLAARGQAFPERGEAVDGAERLDDRRVDRRIRDALELEREVSGDDLTRPAPLAAELEARVVLKEEIGPQPKAVTHLPVRESLRLGDRLGEAGDELVGPLQVVVFDQRVEHVPGDVMLHGRVRDGRIERLRRLVEDGVEDFIVRVTLRVRVVRAAESRESNRECQRGAAKHGSAS